MYIILEGMPGTGKSTIARRLADRLNAKYIKSVISDTDFGMEIKRVRQQEEDNSLEFLFLADALADELRVSSMIKNNEYIIRDKCSAASVGHLRTHGYISKNRDVQNAIETGYLKNSLFFEKPDLIVHLQINEEKIRNHISSKMDLSAIDKELLDNMDIYKQQDIDIVAALEDIYKMKVTHMVCFKSDIDSMCDEIIEAYEQSKKKKSVLLINLPGDSIRKPEEHCGLAYLKAFFIEKNINAEILDCYAKQLNIEECKEKIADWYAKTEGNEHYIGISPFVTSHESFVIIGKFIKHLDNEITVYAGGHYASLNKEYLINKYDWLDAIVVGEGELSSVDLVIRDNIDYIPGVFTKNNSDFFKKRERIENLDELPFQDRYLLPEELKGQPFAITTSRGCYGSCTFCSISSFYKLNTCSLKQTFRSAKSVSEEIHGLVDKYSITSLKVVDDNFFRGTSDTFLEELVSLLSDVKISFRLSARPNDITPYRAELLRELGAVIVGIGAESADEKSLKLFNKGIDISASDMAINLLSQNKITCLANFIMFNPIIDLDGVEKNCAFVEKHIDESVFHRINSHLWIRSTDSIVSDLVELGICKRKGFPYIECEYLHQDINILRELFDTWCNHNMAEYYKYADVIMANGIYGYEDIYEKYKNMLSDDVKILKQLIYFIKQNRNNEAKSYIDKCICNDCFIDLR